MRTKLYLGIDPGVKGGHALVAATGRLLHAGPLPAAPSDLRRSIARWSDLHELDVTIERVAASPQMGVVSAFTFGKGIGIICGVLAGLGLTWQEVSPQVWQRIMASRTGGEKNLSKQVAQALFPGIRVTHLIADAILIAECGRRLDTTHMPGNLTRRRRQGAADGKEDRLEEGQG